MARIYTVGQINTYIRTMFQQDFVLQRVQIAGEISNCKYHTSGHIYFSLKDSTGSIACVMFSGNRTTGLSFRLQNGQQVVVTGQVTVYERDGKYQIYAKKIELQGQGALYEQFLKRKQELEDRGFFAPEYKKPIPAYGKRVGVATASTGAAVRDIIQIAGRRNPSVQIFLRPTIVQGEYAVQSICDAIRELDDFGVDVIIIGRGGGSLEDLWAFNEEAVAEAIFYCGTPVISAVGHETDFTIADFVADLRAPTPSAAAELAVWDQRMAEERAMRIRKKLKQDMEWFLEREKNRMKNQEALLGMRSPQNRLREMQIHLDNLGDRLNRSMEETIQDTRRRQDESGRKLQREMGAALSDSRHRLALQLQRMKGLSPLERLNQGLAVVEKEKEPVVSVKQVTAGDTICVFVSDGRVTAEVTEVSAFCDEAAGNQERVSDVKYN